MRLVMLTNTEAVTVFKGMSYVTTKLTAIVDEFVDSDAAAAEVVFAIDEYANANSCANALRTNIKNAKRDNNIKVIVRKGKVYLGHVYRLKKIGVEI